MRRPIFGYEGYYEVDSDGSIYSIERWVYQPSTGRRQFVPACKRKLSEHETGYLTVRLAKDGVVKTHRVHRLVAIAFIPNPLGLPDVNHRNTNKHCNSDWNLEWCDQNGNMQHAAQNGLTAVGDKNGATKLFSIDIPSILQRYASGDLIQDIAVDFGVGRNAVSDALSRAYGDQWAETLSEKRSRASHVRWGNPIPPSTVISGHYEFVRD
jgi:hypothetical protein